MISENTIQRIKDISIVDVVGKFLKLTKNTAPCPFHNEKSPSFRVNERTNSYKCFGCGMGGDSIKFVQEINKLTFSETLELMAKDHNITVEYTDDKWTPEQREAHKSKLDQAKNCLSFAHEFYIKALQENESAKAYLLERGIDDDMIIEWQLGFADDSFNNITTKLINNGWFEVAHEIGLINRNEEKAKNYDAYRNRIIIPIYDKYAQLVGFGGRFLGDDKSQAKYINPKDSFIYSKDQTLFGLDRAIPAIKEKNRIVLMEGYFDVISCHIKGLDNAVCSCGTSVTDNQFKLMKRYTTNLTTFFDGDAAGQKANEKTILKSIEMGMNPFVVVLEGNEDPDEYARLYHGKDNNDN